MEKGQGVRSLVRGLRVVEVVSNLQPARLSDVARELDEPKSSIQRVLVTLEQAGWVSRAFGSDPGWVLTPKVARLTGSVDGISIRSAALPVMERLRRETNETIHLAVARTPHMLLIERLESTHPVRHVEALGGLASMARTATGRASLSTMPDAFIEEVLAQETDLDSDQRERFIDQIKRAAEVGYATTSEWRDGVHATAAAVRWSGGPTPPPALSISAPLPRVDDEIQELHAELVTAAVQEIASKL